MPRKPQLSPHKCREVKYGSKTQLAPEEETSKPLNDAGIRWVQTIVGALLWIGRAVNNKLLVDISAIGSQQASATEDTNKAIHQLLDYCATYPDDGSKTEPSNATQAATIPPTNAVKSSMAARPSLPPKRTHPSLSMTQESVGSKQLWVHCYGLDAL